MPELNGRPLDGWQDDDVEVSCSSLSVLPSFIDTSEFKWEKYVYVDKTREAQRLAKLAESTSAEVKERRSQEKRKRVEQKRKNAAWSKEADKKTEKDRRKEKKLRKREWLKSHKTAEETGQSDSVAGPKGGKAESDADVDDWDELAREERMAKKVKKGVIDSKAFDEEFVGL